tara:strand:+ start:32 stop:421 length:390 start_codon:yes stop_codon:yes gene_type:complete
MKKILIEVSAGELLDKISILDIKLNKIKEKDSLDYIKKEHQILTKEREKNIDPNIDINPLYLKLKSINEKLWVIEDEKRLCEKNTDFKEKFIKLSRDVHFLNDKRSEVKLEINKILSSNFREVKQYTKY